MALEVLFFVVVKWLWRFLYYQDKGGTPSRGSLFRALGPPLSGCEAVDYLTFFGLSSTKFRISVPFFVRPAGGDPPAGAAGTPRSWNRSADLQAPRPHLEGLRTPPEGPGACLSRPPQAGTTEAVGRPVAPRPTPRRPGAEPAPTAPPRPTLQKACFANVGLGQLCKIILLRKAVK